jgi:hypothetical protein
MPQAAASLDHEAMPAVFFDRDHTRIVQQRLCAIRLTGGKTDLEFARHLLI